jgi:heme oxygenase
MDLSPFQQKIKEKTKDIHSKAEQHPLMQSFINGTYTKEHLLQFLVNMYPIYSVVEQRLLSDKIKENAELKRTEFIESDINNLIPEIINVKNSHLLMPLGCTCGWVSNAWAKPLDFLRAELYSRWLADLYGGRMLTKTVIPHTMYAAENPGNVIKTVREILDEPFDNTNIHEDDIIDEILSFFDFHLELFDAIYNGSAQ